MHILDDTVLAGLGLDAFDFIDAVSAALVAHHRNDLIVLPKRMQTIAGAYAMDTQGMWSSRDMALFHNLVGQDSAGYRSAQVLFRSSDSGTLCFIHGSTISSVLPVAVGIVGARRFAKPRSETLALVGAGLQGRLNLEAYAREFPLKAVRIVSRSKAKTVALAALARDMGLEARVCDKAEDTIRDADIVVSSISESFGVKPFLNVAWLKAGAYVSTVDLLRPWYCEPSASQAFMVADDVAQAHELIATGRVPDIVPIGCGLGESLVEGCDVPSGMPVILLQPGCCAGVFGMVAAVLDRAQRSQGELRGAS